MKITSYKSFGATIRLPSRYFLILESTVYLMQCFQISLLSDANLQQHFKIPLKMNNGWNPAGLAKKTLSEPQGAGPITAHQRCSTDAISWFSSPISPQIWVLIGAPNLLAISVCNRKHKAEYVPRGMLEAEVVIRNI
jgi:hypothetical protein